MQFPFHRAMLDQFGLYMTSITPRTSTLQEAIYNHRKELPPLQGQIPGSSSFLGGYCKSPSYKSCEQICSESTLHPTYSLKMYHRAMTSNMISVLLVAVLLLSRVTSAQRTSSQSLYGQCKLDNTFQMFRSANQQFLHRWWSYLGGSNSMPDGRILQRKRREVRSMRLEGQA